MKNILFFTLRSLLVVILFFEGAPLLAQSPEDATVRIRARRKIIRAVIRNRPSGCIARLYLSVRKRSLLTLNDRNHFVSGDFDTFAFPHPAVSLPRKGKKRRFFGRVALECSGETTLLPIRPFFVRGSKVTDPRPFGRKQWADELKKSLIRSFTIIPEERIDLPGFNEPVGIKAYPVVEANSSLEKLVSIEKNGIVTVHSTQKGLTTPESSQVLLDISALTESTGERGLLDVTFSPEFETNRKIYVYYTRVEDGASVLSEITLNTLDLSQGPPASSTKVLLTFAQPFANHNGGSLVFDSNSMLYLTTGDGGSADDPQNNGQNPNTLLGKVLRLDPRLPAPHIPSDNPFFGNPVIRNEIYALGLRNPYRGSIDPVSGRFLVGDVGQDSFEEISEIIAGGNYGWRITEGDSCFAQTDLRYYWVSSTVNKLSSL